jgi:hypothetical protein
MLCGMSRRVIALASVARVWTWTASAALALSSAGVSGCNPPDSLVPESSEELGWLEDASTSWSDSGVTPLPISAHGKPNVHVVDDVDAACGAATEGTTLGCTHFDPLEIYLSSAIPAPLLVRTVRHEMGHAIRGDGLHLSVEEGCPAHGRGPFVMCPAPGVEDPTGSDVTFIDEGGH